MARPVDVARYRYAVQHLLLTLGHARLLILLARAALLRTLAALGRMAVTNYILQTGLCTVFFLGCGLGYFGRLAYHQLFYVVDVS